MEQVQISERKIEKCRHDGPARHQFLVQKVAYRDNGTAYPFVIEVKETKTAGKKERQALADWLGLKYSGRVVASLDLTPVIAQLF